MNGKCRNCGYPPNETCTHPQCKGAHIQGFCSVSCQMAHYQIKDYELDRERRKMDSEKRVVNG